MSHAEDLAEIIRGMDGDVPDWHSTTAIAAEAEDYLREQRLTSSAPYIAIRQILTYMLRRGIVESYSEGRGLVRYWRLAE